MARAQAHLDKFIPTLAADGRFSRLVFRVSTSEQIWVTGEITSQADLDAARALMRGSHPPCPVRWMPIGPDGTQLDSLDAPSGS